MIPKSWDYNASARRSNAADDYFRDLGLDPRNAGVSVNGPSGITMALGRATNRMLEGNQARAGTRTLYTPEQQNDYLALRDGSGSVYDSPQYGGERYMAPQWMGPEAGLARLNATAANRAYTHYQQQREEERAAAEAAKQSAYDQQVAEIRRARDTVGKLPSELQDVFGQMTPAEKHIVIQSSPEGQYAQLSSSPFRRPAGPLPGKGMSTITPGSSGATLSGGISDYLSSAFSSNPLRDEGVPTMKPLSPTKPKVSLPLPTAQPDTTPWWQKAIRPIL